MPVPVSSAPTATLAFSSQMFGIPISSPPVSDAPPIWDLAARQQLWRERAAHENARLRTVLDTQASLAQSMEYQLGKRIREQLAGHALPFDSFSGTIAQDRDPDFALETETIESLRRKSTNADFRVKQALRRHVEPDRQVVVWVSKAEAVEQQVSAYSNFAFIDKGYVVVKRPTFPDHSQTASTLLQICCLISPQMMRGCVLDVKTAGAFTEFVLSVMVASITATQELVESMLLEEAQQLHVLQQQERHLPCWPIARTTIMTPPSHACCCRLTMASTAPYPPTAATPSCRPPKRRCPFPSAWPHLPVVPFQCRGIPAVTPTLTTATSSPVKKTPTSAAKQQQRKKKAPSSTGKKRKTASHNSNRARDERKEELIYLRKTVQTMEARLRTLQLSQRRALVAPAPAPARAVPQGEAQTFTEGAFALAALQGHAVMSEPPLSCEDMKEDAAMGPVWTEIAARQYQERRRVELENIRLKLILEGQIKMAKSLEKMLTKRTSLRHRKPTSTEEEDEAAIFARLEKELETALDEVDVVFEAIGLSRMEKTYADAQVRRENGTTVMEIFANKVVPFSVEATSHAVWEHFVHSMDHIPSRFVYQKQLKKTETTDDTLMESFGLELVGSRNATAAFRVRQIRRKFVQPHRVVIAWPMYSEALELSAEPTKGVRLHEKCFTVVKALPNASGRRGALIQTCYVLRPEIYGHVADRERILTTLTDFLLDSVSHTISSSHQMIENFLLDGALRFQPEPNALTQVANQESASSSPSVPTSVGLSGGGGVIADEELESLLLEVGLSGSPSINSGVKTEPAALVATSQAASPTDSAAVANNSFTQVNSNDSENARRVSRGGTEQATSGKTKKRVRLNPNRARDNRKNELAYLRNKVKQMEEQLLSLRQQYIENKDSTNTTTTTRSIVETQLAGFNGVVSDAVGGVQGSTWDLLLDKDTYDTLLARAESAYHEVDEVLAANGLKYLETACTNAQMREGPEGMYVDIFTNKMLPFDFKTAAEAVWTHFRGSEKHRGNLYENFSKDVESSSDTVAEMFAIEFMANDLAADFRVKQVVRRYIEEDRQVVVWVSTASALENSKSPFASFGFREKGYVISKRVRGRDDFSMFQTCCLVSPQMSEGGSFDLSTVGTFTEFVLGFMFATITSSQQLIENMLMDQSLQPTASSTTAFPEGFGAGDEGEVRLDAELDRLLLGTLSSSSEHVSESTPMAAMSTTLVTTPMASSLSSPLPLMVANVGAPNVSGQTRRRSRAAKGPTTTLAKRRVKVNPNRARDERKHELAYLRNKVEQMETELETMRHRRRTRGIRSAEPPPDSRSQALTTTCSKPAASIKLTLFALCWSCLQHLETSSDTIMEAFTMEFLGKTTTADFRVKQVIRRFVESDRQVVVWVSIGHALDPNNSPFSALASWTKAT
ncbi:hypothetical protein GQ600_4939 [Phytophthora cactorum]|nr:hypothetical protein GQ600_4939 [Phytophthora cactorum]